MSSPSTLEREALDELERRLADQGYVLQREPRGDALPSFLGKFQPDAIATGKEPNLLIEVITQRGSDDVAATKVRQLKQLLDGHPDWRLEIVYMAPNNPLPGVASVEAIRRRFGEVQRLSDADRPAALVAAWSLLEAVARHVLPERAARALTPATTVELLTSMGYLAQSGADSLRAAIRTRNLIVHGDVGQEVPPGQLANILEIVDALVGHLDRQATGLV